MRLRLGDAGIRVVLTPVRAPNANAYAERFVRSIKEECLDRIIPLGERHFRRSVAQFVEHYHRERNHRALENEFIVALSAIGTTGGVRPRPRLGGLLDYCERVASSVGSAQNWDNASLAVAAHGKTSYLQVCRTAQRSTGDLRAWRRSA